MYLMYEIIVFDEDTIYEKSKLLEKGSPPTHTKPETKEIEIIFKNPLFGKKLPKNIVLHNKHAK